MFCKKQRITKEKSPFLPFINFESGFKDASIGGFEDNATAQSGGREESMENKLGENRKNIGEQ